MTFSCVFVASDSNYSFHTNFLSNKDIVTMNYFRQKILGLVGKILRGVGGGGLQKDCLCMLFLKKQILGVKSTPD